MVLWRDPLDELIVDLERTLPSVSETQQIFSDTTLVGCQMLVGAII